MRLGRAEPPLAGHHVRGRHIGQRLRGVAGSTASRREAVEAVVNILGSIPGVNIGDLLGGLYYLFAFERGHRGCNPELMQQEHPDEDEPPLQKLLKFADYAPAAVYFAYQKACEVQRGLSLRGHRLVLAEVNHGKEQATFFLSVHEEQKEALLLVRGTQSVRDMLTDVNATVEPFSVMKDGEEVSGAVHVGISQPLSQKPYEVPRHPPAAFRLPRGATPPSSRSGLTPGATSPPLAAQAPTEVPLPPPARSGLRRGAMPPSSRSGSHEVPRHPPAAQVFNEEVPSPLQPPGSHE
ncbi:hypothetical protein CYMTET_36506, partial [Cymbomonas tetramitiformis]